MIYASAAQPTRAAIPPPPPFFVHAVTKVSCFMSQVICSARVHLPATRATRRGTPRPVYAWNVSTFPHTHTHTHATVLRTFDPLRSNVCLVSCRSRHLFAFCGELPIINDHENKLGARPYDALPMGRSIGEKTVPNPRGHIIKPFLFLRRHTLVVNTRVRTIRLM